MRTHNAIALLSFAALVGACRGETKSAAISDELKHDLELASSSATMLASAQSAKPFLPTETAQKSAEKASTSKSGAGRKVVRSSTPRIAAAPTPDVAEADVAEAAVLDSASATSASTESTVDETLPAVPRPVPAAIPVSEPAQPVYGSGTERGGSATGEIVGSVIGGILGVIIRGGHTEQGGIMTGDGDRCEIHPPSRGRNRPQPRGGGVYSPNPGGTGGTMGGTGRVYARSRFTSR